MFTPSYFLCGIGMLPRTSPTNSLLLVFIKSSCVLQKYVNSVIVGCYIISFSHVYTHTIMSIVLYRSSFILVIQRYFIPPYSISK